MKSKEEIKQLGSKYALTHEDVSDKLGKYLVSACFQDGYTQCQEDMAKDIEYWQGEFDHWHKQAMDMADKKYTEEDINKAINLARKTRVNVFGANGEESIGFVHSNNEVLKIVTNKQD